MSFLISSAFAESVASAPAGAQQAGGFPFVFMGIIMVGFYLLFWRPQSKRAKEQRNLLNSISKDDEIITAGGLIGRVTKVTDQYISLAVANNLDILLQKNAVVTVLPKGTIKTIV